MQRVYITS